ncbi:molybdenum cofactor biosynthesis protein MoaC [Flavobacterium covae]|uniref:Molybdopterin adenylyltransferase n=3 Tax=Flavobacterium TaxID=237 RepID=A0AA94F2P5_9FLAO|nr:MULTISPECIES: bifunctional molybdenum cofactor biosynthesis protein MoaC/MoaB [Flavobacterium]OXA76221.1 bifunctional molybdenum cofactor biosynthesis protein MoaC/MoaB [Flavobacterium columnare NBRC 100251 = ATCC 23463]AND64885.1 molybdenum cofactor biosynthesis protein MoaC [Flavobacterium covae]MCH4830972.1 bifunctional molybdenum cofactor biosynthesis protein MoaC/MoaB [Flavobacterium columnare]MCH4833087.1 bifunctional molybdenum cofactor biosynthesis protein MoaC/MoaB [Flavobacterium c
MVDITQKSNSLRTAVAQAIVKVSNPNTLEAIIKKNVPKGDVFEASKIAGLFAVKNTSNAIPDCHPLPIEFTSVSHHIQDLNIEITVTVKTIYKTGVEVEAMHGASIVALTMYDMLKPIDKSVEIHSIKLIEKKGGKSDVKTIENQLKIGIIVCSDSISAGKKIDSAGKTIIKKIEKLGLESSFYKIIPDEILDIQSEVMNLFTNQFDLVIITGGTGLSPRDITPEALIPLLDKRIPGIEETIRNYGQQRTPYAMLSRSVVGFKGNMLIMALPGSTNGAAESIEAVFPSVLHLFKIIKGFNHNQ